MNKKGVSLVELLGAIVIMGIMVGLVAIILSMFSAQIDSINIRSRANQEALLIDRTIKDELISFQPTDYSLCGTNCIIFEKHFEYRLDYNNNIVSPFLFSPVLTYRIQILDGDLLINNELFSIPGFSLGPKSIITVTSRSTFVDVVIVLELVSNTNASFLFTTSYSFEILPIPNV